MFASELMRFATICIVLPISVLFFYLTVFSLFHLILIFHDEVRYKPAVK